MSNKTTQKSQPDSRPPVEALQYEKLALQTFALCNRHLRQLNTLITLGSSMCRNPAITSEERKRQQTMLELLVDTAEQYQQELECDRELYQVIALDAKGVPQSRITASRATRLLAEASQSAAHCAHTPEPVQRNQATPVGSTETETETESDTAQPPAPVRH